MIKIGCHLSCSKGYEAMGEQALEIGANTFQFFSRNPRGGNVKAMDVADAAALHALMAENDFGALCVHAPYTLNACAARVDLREFAQRVMREDLKRLESLPGNFYNFHPGSHVGQGIDTGIVLIADLLNEVMEPDSATKILLETMAGKGSEVGSTFEELRAIIDRCKLGDNIGVCLDTCHVYDAGYDIVGDLDGVLQHFDEVIGLDRLCAIHLNDSMNPIGSHKDRHATIGSGTLGLDAIGQIINHPRLRSLPFYLETPNDEAGHGREIALLRSMVEG